MNRTVTDDASFDCSGSTRVMDDEVNITSREARNKLRGRLHLTATLNVFPTVWQTQTVSADTM